jgi:hypothetical protein
VSVVLPTPTTLPLGLSQPEFDDLPLDKLSDAERAQAYWSVTTIVGVLEKRALQYWAAEETAKTAVRWASSLPQRIREDGEEAVIKTLANARFQPPPGKERSATELGIAVHAACERYVITGRRPDVDAEVAPFLDSFERWAQSAQPEYEAAEVTVYSPTYGYAGTLDCMLRLAGPLVIADYKTSRKDVTDKGKPTTPYPETALQLAAYRYAELAATWKPRRFEHYRRRYYMLSEAEQGLALAVPEVTGGVCIWITPVRCQAYPVNCGPEIFELFLFLLEAAQFPLATAKTVIGPALEFR